MENWRDVTSYEGFYQVSDQGQVRALTGYRAGLLKGDDSFGYRRVALWQDGRAEKFMVHVLVMIHFVGVAPEGKEVNHKNGNRADNRLENLEYVTRSQNQKHAYDVLGKRSQKGSAHGRSKLTEDQVIEMRRMYKQGFMITLLASIFRCSIPTVSMIINRKIWKHVI